ncbi:MAG TPA: methyltransferase domain-containing protein [Longimicrobiaceae bacterium]
MRTTRVPGSELMDRLDVASAALAEGLSDLRRVNRWFGGGRAALRAALPAIRAVDAPTVKVLDVATGSADIPLALVRRTRAEGLRVHVVASDLHPETLSVAREVVADEPAIEVARADALDLPFADAEFHVAMCHTSLHHFADREARQLLSELGRVASHAVVVTDLARGRLAELVVRLLAATLWRAHPVTRHDSVVSIRAAYTADEAAELARAAGLEQIRTRRHLFFRFSLVAAPAARGR